MDVVMAVRGPHRTEEHHKAMERHAPEAGPLP